MKRLCYSFVTLIFLAACVDPLAGVDRLDDVELSPVDPVAQALPDAAEVEREGFFGTPAATANRGVPEARAIPEQGGFLSNMLGRLRPAQPDVRQVETASLTPAEAATPAPRAGILRRKPASGPDAVEVAYGTVLPFGQIARVCEARSKPMGRKIDKISARGFALWDSAPEQAQPRTFYVTGYDDNCPRQFTAATALFGAPSLYELLRFSPAGKNLPYSDTDKAYDKVKSSVCGAGKRKPCGKKVGQLDKTTAFISAYEVFGDTSRWAEFLVHDGATLAAALKD